MSIELLKKSKRGRPVTGEAQTAAERMRRYRARQRVAGLRVIIRYESPSPARLSAALLEQRIIEARDLALHCLAAKKIDGDRSLLTKVRRRLEYWRRNYADQTPPRDFDEWAVVLSRPWSGIALFITDPGRDAAKLRRRSPLEIALSPRERKRIYAAFAA